jgi:hypothetical protein
MRLGLVASCGNPAFVFAIPLRLRNSIPLSLQHQCPLKFGERCKERQHQPTLWRLAVDSRSGEVEDAERYTLCLEVLNQAKQMGCAPGEPVELCHDERIAFATPFERCLKLGPRAHGADLLREKLLASRPGERIALRIETCGLVRASSHTRERVRVA